MIRNDTYKVNGRTLAYGTEFTAKRLGRVRFIGHVISDTSEWLDCVDKKLMVRSCSVDEVKRVHRTQKIGRRR